MKNKLDSLTGFINKRLILVTLISALLASIISSIYTLTEFNIALKPELLNKAEAVASVVVEDMGLALGAGVPVDEIRGMDKYLEDTVDKYPELTFISVADNNGNFPYKGGKIPANMTLDGAVTGVDATDANQALQADFLDRLQYGLQELVALLPGADSSAAIERFMLPLSYHDQTYGAVLVGLDPGYIRTQLTDVFFDIAIVLVAVLLVSFEVVMVVVMFYVSAPLQESEERLKRQAAGDFSVGPEVTAKGSIGSFIGTLDKDSAKLQHKFRSLMSRTGVDDQALSQESADDEQTKSRLKRLASTFNLLKVMNRRKGEIMDARIPLFVFSFAEELQKSFMPLFVSDYYEPNAWFSKDVMLGLPISVFMFVIAAATPFAGGWVDRWGQKRLFFWGLIPAIAGYLGCFMASSINEIVIWRGITAFGYAIITISCQSYIAAVVSSENRAKGMAIFVGVLMTATMCGTALGAIIADRIGYQPVFLISAALSLFAGFLAWRMLSTDLGDAAVKAATGGQKTSAWPLARNFQFIGTIIFCAIPAKIILTGFLYYMVPLYLVSLDATQSEIGRIMMVYSLVIIPLSPLASRIADQTGKMKELVILATILSGGILISLYGEASVVRVFLAVILMGAAHSILKAPLIATAIEAAEQTPGVGRTTAMGILRTSERIGSVLGPVIVATLLSYYDYGQAMTIVGVGVVIAGIVMAIYLKSSSSAKGVATV